MRKATRMVRRISKIFIGACIGAAALAVRAGAVPAKLDVDVDKPGVSIPPGFGGLMTEEINHSYDGGLLAELIQNRTFQDPLPRGAKASPWDLPAHWSDVGLAKVSIDRDAPVSAALPLSLRVELAGAAGGVANDGYWGIPVRPDTSYAVSFYAKG